MTIGNGLQDRAERNVVLLIVLIVLAAAVGGLVQIVPLFFQLSTTQPIDGLQPYNALQLAGRDVYIREGCYNCHSQMIRPFRAETERYGQYSLIGEAVYDRPFQFGSKRTGPDLARVGGRYSDEWHRLHLLRPRDLVPESNMPGFPWLEENQIDAVKTAVKLQRMQALGVPYTTAEIDGATELVDGKSEMDALIAYMQMLGISARQRN